MDTVSVRCNSCGAPLEAGGQARFVTCKFCNSQLEIKHTGSSCFTEEISQIARNTEQMAENLEAIKLQNEIEMLDRESSTASIADLSRNPGSGRAGGIVGILFAIFFAIVCFAMARMAGRDGAPGIFVLVPVGMGILVLIAACVGFSKSNSLAEKQDGIRRRRDELAQKLEEFKSR